jgi:ubiquinol-cytochrome c reductase subunit 6
MGFFDSWSELVAAATPWSTVEAEAPEKPEEKDDAEVRFISLLLIL